MERKRGDDWVVAGVRCVGRGRKTWYGCVKDDMKALGLHPEWAVFRDMWRHRRSHRTGCTGPDPTNFWDSNMGPPQNFVAKYFDSLHNGPYHLFNPGGASVWRGFISGGTSNPSRA